MNSQTETHEQRELFPEDIDNIVGLLEALRSEILRCQDQYRECSK